MYRALWRHLPGGRLAKLVQSLVLVGLAVALLFLWLFPLIARETGPREFLPPTPTRSSAR